MTVHNHGTEDGPGLSCPERSVDGKLRGKCMDAPVIPVEAVASAVSRIVYEAKALALEEVADHIAARVEAGDTALVTPVATIAWLRERAEHLRTSSQV